MKKNLALANFIFTIFTAILISIPLQAFAKFVRIEFPDEYLFPPKKFKLPKKFNTFVKTFSFTEK